MVVQVLEETPEHKELLDPLDPAANLAETETPEELDPLDELDTLVTEVAPEIPVPMVLPERVVQMEHQMSNKEVLADLVILDVDILVV